MKLLRYTYLIIFFILKTIFLTEILIRENEITAQPANFDLFQPQAPTTRCTRLAQIQNQMRENAAYISLTIL